MTDDTRSSDPAGAVPGSRPREARPDPKLLELLVCPLTKTGLSYDPRHNELVSSAAKLAFPIRDGIPIMLASEARRLED